MAPTDIPAALYKVTTTYRGLSRTYTYTYTYDYPTYTYSYPTYRYPSLYYYYDFSGTYIALGVVFGLKALSLIILAIVYYKRQKRRKAWYGPMAAHYRNGGAPPWVTAPVGVGNGSVKSPLVSPTQSAYPNSQYENSPQFGVYGNLPTAPYSNPTGVMGYTAASYHSGNSVPPTPVPQSLSPQPRHSQYSSTSFEPYNAPPNLHHSIIYAPSPGTPTQFSPPPSSAYAAPNPYGAPATHGTPGPPTPGPPGTPAPPGTPGPHHGHTPTFAMAYGSPPKAPEYVEASGSAQAPAYSGGPYTANEYITDKK